MTGSLSGSVPAGGGGGGGGEGEGEGTQDAGNTIETYREQEEIL